MNDFITWINLLDYITLVGIVIAIVQVTKDIKYIKSIATKHWSIIVAFILVLLTNVNFKTFRFIDIVIYLINAVFISVASNGTYDFEIKSEKEIEKDE